MVTVLSLLDYSLMASAASILLPLLSSSAYQGNSPYWCHLNTTCLQETANVTVSKTNSEAAFKHVCDLPESMHFIFFSVFLSLGWLPSRATEHVKSRTEGDTLLW